MTVDIYTLTPAERERLEQTKGIIFDVQRYSLHDGPGLRTNIFFKGCPLRCLWCANPESQQMEPELALFAHNCIRCGQYAEACPVRWQAKNGGWNESLLAELSERAALCPTEAIHWLGQSRTAGEVIAEALRDAPFYEDGGGITLTGGEPTMQPAMAEALLRLAKAEYIATAIESCGHTQWSVWERLLPYLDTILYDVKHMDDETHRAFTGAGNELILANLRRLANRGAAITIRVPLIPGFNAEATSLRAIAEFVVGLPGPIRGLDLLPYHTLGQAKYAALGRDYPYAEHDRLSDKAVAALVAVVEEYGLQVTVGG